MNNIKNLIFTTGALANSFKPLTSQSWKLAVLHIYQKHQKTVSVIS